MRKKPKYPIQKRNVYIEKRTSSPLGDVCKTISDTIGNICRLRADIERMDIERARIEADERTNIRKIDATKELILEQIAERRHYFDGLLQVQMRDNETRQLHRQEIIKNNECLRKMLLEEKDPLYKVEYCRFMTETAKMLTSMGRSDAISFGALCKSLQITSDIATSRKLIN